MWWALAKFKAAVSECGSTTSIKPTCQPVLLGTETFENQDGGPFTDHARWQLGNSTYLRGLSSEVQDLEYKVPTQGIKLHLFGADLGGFGGVITLSKNGKEQKLPAINVASGKYVETTIPPGAGDGHKLQYEVAGQQAVQTTIFSYEPPVVTKTAPEEANTRGGQDLVITGRNFGVDKNAVSVFLRGLCNEPCPVTKVTHTSITCTVPSCQGRDVPIEVTAGGLVSPTLHLFSYLPAKIDGNRTTFRGQPACTRINNQTNCTKVIEVETSGGSLDDYLTLYGENFGKEGYVTVGSCNAAPYQEARSVICPPESARDPDCKRPVSCATCVACIQAQKDAGLNSTDRTALSSAESQAIPSCRQCQRLKGAGGIPVTFSQPTACGARPATLRNCDCLHTTDSVRFQLPPDAGFGGERPVSVDIGGVVSTIDIRVRYLPPSVTGLAAGQDTSTFSTSGEDANGKKFTITIAGSSFGNAFDTFTVDRNDKCERVERSGNSIEVRVVQPDVDVSTYGPGTPCTGEVVDGKAKPQCTKCNVVTQSQTMIVCEPGAGFGTNLQVVVLRQPPLEVTDMARRDLKNPKLTNTTDVNRACEVDASLCVLGSGTASFDYAPPVVGGFSPTPFNAFEETGTFTITGANFGEKSTPVKVTIIGVHPETGLRHEANSLPCVNAKWDDGGLRDPEITCQPAAFLCGLGNGGACAAGQIEDAQLLGGYLAHSKLAGISATTRACFSHVACDKLNQITLATGIMFAGAKIIDLTVAEQDATTFVFKNDTGIPSPAVTRVLRAVCKPGFFGNSRANYGRADAGPTEFPLERCSPCQEDRMICDQEDTQTPKPKPGWWRQGGSTFELNGGDRTSDEYGCSRNTRSRFNCDVYVPCEPAEACTTNNVCAVGYEGERCSECAKDADGYPEYFKISGICKPCPACPVCLLLVMIGLGGFACSLCYVFTKKRISLGIFSIGFDYFQIIAILATSNRIRWPKTVTDIFETFSVANFNLDLMAPECSFPAMTYTKKWISIELLPFVALACFLSIHFAKYAHKKFVQRRTKKLHNHIHMVIGMSLTAMYYFYLYMTKVSLDIFNCSPTSPPDGQLYLEVVFESCGKEGGVHKTLLPYAILAFCVYTVGYPVLCAVILFRNKERIKEDQLLRARGTGESRESNPNCHDFRKRYSRLYFHFKPHHYYWILLILGRKFMIATASLIFRRTPVFLLAFMLLIVFISYALQVRHQPYMSMSERAGVVAKFEAESAGHDVATYKSKKRAEKRLKKAKIRFGEKITLQKAEATAEYFWNYNTVEAVLLFCAFLIVLMGLMFQSEGVESGSAGETSTISFTLFVLGFSVIYFIIVLSSELILGLGMCQKLCKKKVEKLASKMETAIAQDEARDETMGAGDEIEFSANLMHLKRHSANPVAEKAGQDALRELDRSQQTIEQLQAEVRELKKKIQAANLKGFGNSRASGRKQPSSHRGQAAPSARGKMKKTFAQQNGSAGDSMVDVKTGIAEENHETV